MENEGNNGFVSVLLFAAGLLIQWGKTMLDMDLDHVQQLSEILANFMTGLSMFIIVIVNWPKIKKVLNGTE